MKKANEEMVTVDKDITVLSMLIDGTLPDDMKQQSEWAFHFVFRSCFEAFLYMKKTVK